MDVGRGVRPFERNANGGRRAAAPRRKLDPPVNVNGSEIGALFSPSGRSLLFARDLKGSQSGEFFVWHIQGREDPPQVKITVDERRVTQRKQLENIA